MAPTVERCVPTIAACVRTERATVDSRDGEENFVRREDVQG